MLGNLKIVADKKLEDDGETTFVSLDRNGESKKATVKIKKSVADAVHVCWRMSTLLHELHQQRNTSISQKQNTIFCTIQIS